jgi:hypothetical protein
MQFLGLTRAGPWVGQSHYTRKYVNARIARDSIQILLLPKAQQNPLHPFGGVNTR